MLAGDSGEMIESPGEAAFLVLVVDPAARGRGAGHRRPGFVRLPRRDWSPAPGVDLLVHALDR